MSHKSKLWAGRFSEPTEKIVEEFNASISFDKLLAVYDIQGSIAHARMLGAQNIITNSEAGVIIDGLNVILKEITSGAFEYRIADEDIHMAVETRLTELVGSVGGKLHTARSRNDQVAVDFRLYTKHAIIDIQSALKALMQVVAALAKKHIDQIMPGYTHMQTAQPILFSHYLMAYFQMFKRDYTRFADALERMDYSPLGAGALAGTTFPIDRHATAKELGFKAPTENSLDSVSDRDFAIEFLSASSICIMHLSRMAEELIIYSSSEFAFIEISDGFSTGSSIMPQKKNPDIPELIRGKTGRVYGSLMALLTVMKGLPLAYNKDMQEDKENVFDAAETVNKSLLIFAAMLKKITVNNENMLKASMKGYSNATDLADYLVRKQLPFREAHHVSGQAVAYAVKHGKMLQELSINEFKKFSALIDNDIYNHIAIEVVVNNRNSYGGTSASSVALQIESAENFIKGLV